MGFSGSIQTNQDNGLMQIVKKIHLENVSYHYHQNWMRFFIKSLEAISQKLTNLMNRTLDYQYHLKNPDKNIIVAKKKKRFTLLWSWANHLLQ